MSEGISLGQINRPTINMDNTNVANNPNDKASGEEYFDRRGQNQGEEEFQQSPFVDRSAQLRATLNSLAALNAASVVKAKNKYKNKISNNTEIQDNSKKILAINEDNQESNEEQNNQNQDNIKENKQDEIINKKEVD